MGRTGAFASFPVLLVTAHPDDESVFGGILGRLKEREADVRLICVTRGEGSPINRIDGDLSRLGQIRPTELRRAGELLGLREIIQLEERDEPCFLPGTICPSRDAGMFEQSGAWDLLRIERAIEELSRRLRPRLVLTMLAEHPEVHAHHQVIARQVVRMAQAGKLGPDLLAIYGAPETPFCPIGTFPAVPDQIEFPLDEYSPRLRCTYSEFQSRAAACHRSQITGHIGPLTSPEILVPLHDPQAQGRSLLLQLLEKPHEALIA